MSKTILLSPQHEYDYRRLLSSHLNHHKYNHKQNHNHNYHNKSINSEAATSAWLASGGDGRVTLHCSKETDTCNSQSGDDANDVGSSRANDGSFVSIGVNSYGTSTSPRPDVIERSSCTSSSPRLESFAYADATRAKRLELGLEHVDRSMEELPVGAKAAVSNLVEENRFRLLQVLGLKENHPTGNGGDNDNTKTKPKNEGVSIIMCASGTDAEIIAALAGIAAASPSTIDNWTSTASGAAVAPTPSLLSILMPGTGSGVGDAAGMRHHSAAAPQLGRVQPGEVLEGVLDGMVVAVEPDKDGVDLSDALKIGDYIDQKRRDLTVTTDATGPHVLLHAIAGSKTGLHHPPIAVTDALVRDRMDMTVIIDACQMRVTPKYIRTQLAKGYVVLLTGSKFYGGPPFAGACLLPAHIARKMEAMAAKGNGAVPSGLAAYFTRDDVPHSMPILRMALPDKPNPGLALRWTASLYSMERYHALPTLMTERIAKRWVSRVRALAEGFYPAVEVLELGALGDGEGKHRIGKVNTIVSIMVRTGGGHHGDENGGGSLLSVRCLKQLQILLETDLSCLCDGTTFPKSARDVARIRTQLGQPVVLGEGVSHGVVRVALGATDICEAVEKAVKEAKGDDDDDDDDDADPFVILDALEHAIDAAVVNDVQLFRKVELLANHWSEVEKGCNDLPATALRRRSNLMSQGVSLAIIQEGMREQEVTNVDITWLKPHEKVVNQERVDALIDAITRWDAYRKPLLVDRDSGSILDGHHRYYAALGLGLNRVPAALVDYLNDDSITVDVWHGGGHGLDTISKQDVIDMCLSIDVFPPKTSMHTFRDPLLPIFVPLDQLRDDE